MENGAEPTFRTERYIWLKAKVKIDLLSIDEELEEIPTLIQETGECVSIAMELRELAKEDLEVARAIAATRLRLVPKADGKSRSEAQIESEIPADKGYQDQLGTVSIARLDAALWQTLMEAFRSKSSVIRTTADLITAGYLTSDYIMSKRRAEIRRVKPKVAS